MGTTLIVGSGGRLGAALMREWSAAGELVIGLSHSELDIGNKPAVAAKLGGLDFDVLVNCAALTNVDYCETNPEEAHLINTAAVQTLGEICAKNGARCVHISTDYVFDGGKRTPYGESDPALPISVYGESKLRGESALAESCPDHLVARVSWVFGPDRPSFIDQIVNRAREHETVQAIGDKWAVPSYTLDIAKYLRPLLRDQRHRGVVHMCNSGECTWKEYGQFALMCAKDLGIALKAQTVEHLAMADLKAFVAKRPVYTVMSTWTLADLIEETPRPWEEAVTEYLRTYLR
jgi:dTDP-4-dehydrorhamnose reductase